VFITGGLVSTTAPVIGKLNGFSSGSLLLMLMLPLLVPSKLVLISTVKLSDAPGSNDATSPSVTEKPAGRLTEPSVSALPPSLRTVKVTDGGAELGSTVPKLTAVGCPSAMLVVPRRTVISAAGTSKF